MTTNEHTNDTDDLPVSTGPEFGPSLAFERRRLALRNQLLRRPTLDCTLAQVQATLTQRNQTLAEVEKLHHDLQVEFFQELASDKADALNTSKLREMISAYQQTALAINRMMDDIMIERVQLLVSSRNLAKDELEQRPNSAFHDEMPQEY